jgi:transcriptional regulator with XRE-family HTH domain
MDAQEAQDAQSRQGPNVHIVQLSEKLRILTSRLNLTQETLGERLGIVHTTVGRWLAGKSRPYQRHIIQIAEIFGLSVDDLADDSKEIPASAWERMKSSNIQAQLKYPNNKQAADENFDAQLFENLAQRTMREHAKSLRDLADVLTEQADDFREKAAKIESRIPSQLVSQDPQPKPMKRK